MIRRACIVLAGVGAFAAACAHQAPSPATPAPAPAKATDPASHAVRLVEVAPGVSLEVLDFGGQGEPMVFLAGLGNTAHIFDDFAPAFADHHHVIAITRRGFGASSWPETGYDVAARVADDLAVLDKLGMPHAIFVGHSLAGDELTELAASHADRVHALVYVDAAHDHVAVRELLATKPEGTEQPPPPAALATRAGFTAWFARTVGFDVPAGEHVALLELGPTGAVTGMHTRPDVQDLYLKGTAHADLGRVHVPALVLLAIPAGPEEALPGYRDLEASARRAIDAWWPRMAELIDATRSDVKAHLAGARVVEYPHGNHYLFITQRAQVLAEMRGFDPIR